MDKKKGFEMSIIYEPKGRAREYSLLAANIYDGCEHGCRYCYVPGILRKDREAFHKAITARKDVVGRVEADAKKLACTDKRVLLCFACDPYQPIDNELQLTRDVIRILRGHHIPFQVLTKGGMRSARDFDLYEKYDAFATTLTFLNPADSIEWEPCAPLPADRIKAIKEAKAAGLQTWVSLEPVIDPAQSINIIHETCGFVDHYKIGKWNHDGRAEEIDWQLFGKVAIALCKQYGKTYYVKKDLWKYLDGVEFTNTDTRIVV